MDLQKDSVMTDAVRTKIENMKKQQGEQTAAGAITVLLIAAFKLALASALIVWGWLTLADVYKTPKPTFWQAIIIVMGIRAAQMLLIEPMLKLFKPKKD